MRRFLVRAADRAVAVRFAAVVLPLIGLLTVAGTLATFGTLPLDALDLNGERNLPAAFSAVLLVAAAAAALVTSATWGERRPGRKAASVLAALFAFMALDEVGQLHEKLERIVGMDWQTLYLPLAAVGAVAWAVMLRWLWPKPAARILFVLGAAAWVVAQSLEAVQYDASDQRVAAFNLLVSFEEPLEMLGSAFLALGPLVAAARRPEAVPGTIGADEAIRERIAA